MQVRAGEAEGRPLDAHGIAPPQAGAHTKKGCAEPQKQWERAASRQTLRSHSHTSDMGKGMPRGGRGGGGTGQGVAAHKRCVHCGLQAGNLRDAGEPPQGFDGCCGGQAVAGAVFGGGAAGGMKVVGEARPGDVKQGAGEDCSQSRKAATQRRYLLRVVWARASRIW